MDNNIIFKCNNKKKRCEHVLYIPTKDIDYIIPFCKNISKCDYKLEVVVTTRKYVCYFMFDNHTFEECSGTLIEIRDQLVKLFEMDKYGGWGRLRFIDSKENDYIIDNLEWNLSKLDKLIKEKTI